MKSGASGGAHRRETRASDLRRGSAFADALRRARRTTLLAAFALAFAVPAPAPAAAPGDLLGVYNGSGNVAGTTAFGNRLERRLGFAHDFLERTTWAAMNDTAWLARSWAQAGYTDGLVLTVPMIPDTGGTLAAGAAGQYNEHFRTLAETLVASGQGSVVLRLGPEFNGNWYAWTIDVPDGGALYAAYWRQIVDTMLAVPGANFRFDWCANNGSSWTPNGQLESESAWPGDAYVDYVGLDVYDQSWAPWKGDPAARWNEFLDARNGMRWHAAFAAAHGKPMTFPEWGLAHRSDGNGGGDAPYFVEQMYWWIRSHPVAYHLYFESADPNGEYAVFSGWFPTAAERFVTMFGPNGPTEPPPSPQTGAAPQPAALVAVPAPLESPGANDPREHGGASARDATAGAGAAAGDVDVDRSDTGGRTGARAWSANAAKLSIKRARLVAHTRVFELLAPISRRASGTAGVTLHAGGERTRFTAPVDSARGTIRLRKRVSAGQARAGTGIVTIRYGGDNDTQPSSVRLRAAPRRAGLRAARPRIADGRLRTQGTISRRARGVVRLQIVFTVGGERLMIAARAPIADGRWQLDAALDPSALALLAQRDDTAHAYTLYTGYLPARIGGEMRSAQVLGAR